MEGLLLLFGFMVLGGFEVERGFIAEIYSQGRVLLGSIGEVFDVVENHASGFWKR